MFNYWFKRRKRRLDIGQKLQKLLQEEHGLESTYRSFTHLSKAKSSYYRYDLDCKPIKLGALRFFQPRSEGVPQSFFLKWGGFELAHPVLERFLNSYAFRTFATARFFGHFRHHERAVFVWEFVEGDQPVFAKTDMNEMALIVEAVAEINAVPEELASKLDGVRVKIPYLAPVAERVEALVRSSGLDQARQATLLTMIELFSKSEGALLRRFEELGQRHLTHDDLVGRNILIRTSDNRMVLLDWENVYMSAAGTGLRVLARWEAASRDVLAAHYVACLARLGFHVPLRDVLFAIEGAHTLQTLHWGVTHTNLNRIESGLAFFHRFRKRLTAHAPWLLFAGAA